MWGTLKELTTDLSHIYLDTTDTELDLLLRAFGKTKFIYLQRKNVLSQAISLYRAEQSNYWHSTQRVKPTQLAHFDFDEINLRVNEIDEHNIAWQNWFSSNGIKPFHISYEDLDADPKKVTLDILDFLEIVVPDDVELRSSNQRLADAKTELWRDQFSIEMKRRLHIT